MILEVGADSLVFNLALNPSGFEYFRIADARQLQNLRALYSTARHNHFSSHGDYVGAAIVRKLHSRSLVAFKFYSHNKCVTQDMQIWPMGIGGKVPSRCVAALTFVRAATDN